MSRVLEELNPLLKCIRKNLNDLNIRNSAPKARNPSNGKRGEPQAASAILLTEDSLGGKAGKIVYPILVGEVSNLYKSPKSSTRSTITIDLHGYSKDKALDALDENISAWVDAAMR
ncbi:hypothetical protein ACHAXR_000205, partial [Thalassiosira sp. AJA248-18]